MHVSVIFTTYNQPRWLEKVLWGFSVQNHTDFELIVADDGSGRETRAVIDRFRAASRQEIQHVWHADRGFCKCAILNRAIVASNSDYLIFTDGDCVPAPDFVQWHVRLAARGRFLSGGYVKLPRDVSQRISTEDVISGNATSAAWLARQGMRRPANLLKLSAGPVVGSLLDGLTSTRASWNGHNASTWKAAVLAANGFDERMQYGGQDREFGERLTNMGIRGRRIRYRAACVHLDHDRGYARPESIARNRIIREETRRLRIERTAFGIEQARRRRSLPSTADAA